MNRLLPVTLSVLLLAACSPAVKTPGVEVKGSTAREMGPDTSDVATLASENSDFSFDFLRTVDAQAPGNEVVSPWSLQVVMAQVYDGAAGDAKTAIASTFGWDLADDALNAAFDASDLDVTGHDDASADPPVVVTTTNQIFVANGYDLGADWLNTLSGWYGTGVQQMDFVGDPAGTADDINAWIADRTGDHIKDLVTSDVISNSKMLLANALYFNAAWELPFDASNTKDAPFTLADGSVVNVPTMNGSVVVDGYQADGFFVADMPYSDPGLTMTIVLPDAGQFDAVLAGLNDATLSAAIAAEYPCSECSVALPKFEVSSKPDVTGALTTLGMGAAFWGDYSPINPELTLAQVEQEGFVSVSENGTEAAAATVAEFTDGAIEEPPFGPIVVDRPFLWLVREPTSGAVLFAGVVRDPR